jgi:hypothetical protein
MVMESGCDAYMGGDKVPGADVCCERCPGASRADISHLARRRLLKTAVFQPAITRTSVRDQPGQAAGTPAGAPPSEHGLYRAVTGRIADISPHVVVIGEPGREQRFALAASTKAWRGGQVEPFALQLGDQAVIRLLPSQPRVADRIWANIGRVTGTIVKASADGLLVDEGRTKQHQQVIIPSRVSERIRVRFPKLLPGFLVDIIGLRRDGALEGLIPGTYQPPYRVDQIPPPDILGGPVPPAILGSATWYDAPDDPHGLLGACYPAIDPAAGCAEVAGIQPDSGHHAVADHTPTFRTLPYLAVGSILAVRNECTGMACNLPITSCAPVARLFNDRCLTCGTSQRGRVADLTLASFVALGGELEQGCFNAAVTIGA